MHEWIWLVPLLPFAGSLFLFASLGKLPRLGVSIVGVGSVGLAALAAIAVAVAFFAAAPSARPFEASIGTWIAAGDFAVAFDLRLDSLSLVMILVVTVVAFLIHLYSTVYMAGDEGYSRFFAYMNLFTASMLVLVLGANLLLLYLGWEGVGLCSYLLIGFWYADPENGSAARKAFIVTRVGDAAMLIGLILLATSLGTLDIQGILGAAASQWAVGSGTATAAAALLLAGAVGKSAQLPLQTWLPDAMAGPTPVSALLHAATMVTAGVYLLARTNELFVLAPPVHVAVAVIGALTLLIASFSALAENDIKRVLAYSTMSQIGYMFLALGIGAWTSAVFHFMTHAFFKALLFLAAGAVLMAVGHERDIFKMGGLRSRLPGVFWAFLAGASALAAVPLISAGFYSKDQILMDTWQAGTIGRWLWVAGIVAAFLTAVYIFRVVFIVFFGTGGPEPGAEGGHGQEGEPAPAQRYAVLIPLAVLSLLSVAGGFLDTPEGLGHVRLFTDFLATSLPSAPTGTEAPALGPELAAVAASLGGIFVAYWVYFPGRAGTGYPLAERPWTNALLRLWAAGWGFDRLYDVLFVTPFLRVAAAVRGDPIDGIYTGLASSMRAAWRAARLSQTGELRWYAAGMLAGLVILMAVTLFL